MPNGRFIIGLNTLYIYYIFYIYALVITCAHTESSRQFPMLSNKACNSTQLAPSHPSSTWLEDAQKHLAVAVAGREVHGCLSLQHQWSNGYGKSTIKKNHFPEKMIWFSLLLIYWRVVVDGD